MVKQTTSCFEPPDYDEIRYFIVGARPVMRVKHEGRMWTESIDWETGEFKLDMDYFERVVLGTNVEVDWVDLELFSKRVMEIRDSRT